MQNDSTHPNPKWPILATLVLVTLGSFTLSAPMAQAQAPQRFHTQPELDLSLSKQQSSAKAKPFVVRETYRQPETDDQGGHGVVGLDMAIRPGNYPMIQSVFPGTPAHQQGIRPHDVLVAINGTRTFNKDVNEVDALISDVPGDVISLTLLRGGQLKQVRLTVVSVDSLSREMQASFSYLLPGP